MNPTIHSEALKGDVNKVKDFVTKGISVDVCDSNSWSLLHCAARFNHIEVAEFLMDAGCDLEVKTLGLQTPLLLAAESGSKGVVDLLIKKGADLRSCNCEGWNLLHFACKLGWLDIVEVYVDEKLDLDAKTFYGRTPLLIAAEYLKKDVVLFLIEKGANVKKRGVKGQSLLYHAIRSQWLDVVRICVNKKCNVNGEINGDRLVLVAGSIDDRIVDMLIEGGADVNISNERGWTLLHQAASRGMLQFVMHLIAVCSLQSMHLDLSCRNSDGDTPLHIACYNKNAHIARCLLEAGAKWDIRNDDGENAIDCFLNVKHFPFFEFISLFLNEGAFLDHCEYLKIVKKPALKKRFLKNVELCTKAILNKFNKKYLPQIYELYHSVANLPSIDVLEIKDEHYVAYQVKEKVESEIISNGYCNIISLKLSSLKILCIRFIVNILTLKGSKIQDNVTNPVYKRRRLN